LTPPQKHAWRFMVRPLTVYPTTGFAKAPPAVADPIVIAPFTLTFIQWDEVSASYKEVTNSIGVPWDDDVAGGGGLCHGLVTVLESLWQQIATQCLLRPIIDFDSQQQFALAPGSNLLQFDGARVAYLHVVAQAPQTDYWYKSNDFAKFGWCVPFDPNLTKANKTWWNFTDQVVFIDDIFTAGVEVFLIGPESLGVVELFGARNPPAIQFTGYTGFTGTYDEKGLHT